MSERISCEIRDEKMAAYHWTPVSSLTDADGIYGKPTVYTEWENPLGDRLEDRRWVHRGSYSSPDPEPCEHYFTSALEVGGEKP